MHRIKNFLRKFLPVSLRTFYKKMYEINSQHTRHEQNLEELRAQHCRESKEIKEILNVLIEASAEIKQSTDFMQQELPVVLKELSSHNNETNKMFCIVCGKWADSFLSFGAKKRENAQCPSCHSLERHRAF